MKKILNIEFFKDKYFLSLLFVIVILLVFKWQDLYLPYFSDELWAYGPAIRKMAVNGPSLFPSALSLNDHFAHPLLFFFLSSVWGSVFGVSLFSTHFFAAMLSVFLLLIFYWVINKVISKEVGFYSTLIFSFQSIYLGQFNLLLPEVLLTIFVMLSIYFSIVEKWKSYLIVACCMVLTKESGVFPLVGIIIWNIIKDIGYKRQSLFRKNCIIKYLVLGSPVLALLVHFIMLKIEYGWFIMPLRVDSMDFSWNYYHERLMNTIHYVFIGQGRKPMTIALFFIGILFYNKISFIKRLLFLGLGFVILKVFFRYWKMNEVVEYTIVPLMFVVVAKTFFFDQFKTSEKVGSVVSIFTLTTILYILFISSFFDSRRYLYFLIPMFITITVYYLSILPYYKKYVVPFFTIIFFISSIIYQRNDTNYGDDTNHYSSLCLIQKEAVGYLENNFKLDQKIVTSFLFKHSIERPLSGYLKSNNGFINVVSQVSNVNKLEGGIYVFVSSELPINYKEIKNKLTLLKKVQNRDCWIEIYKY